MSERTSIEWTDASWNPVTGCTQVSPGCDHCYAETFAERWRGTPGHYFEQGFDVTLRPDKLSLPLRWRKPRRIFVNSMSDLFHQDIPDDYIARVFAVMAATPQHTYQLLTKRHGRMRSLIGGSDGSGHRLLEATTDEETARALYDAPWPLPNVWLGVSVEDQKTADLRIPVLLATPAAVRWLSCEPLLGHVDLARFLHWRPIGENLADAPMPPHMAQAVGLPALHWVVAGGESGSGARPMHPDWARSLRDQCLTAGVPFFLKQWGEWAPNGQRGIGWISDRERLVGDPLDDYGHREVIERIGKKSAGRELDGRTWDQYPTAGVR